MNSKLQEFVEEHEIRDLKNKKISWMRQNLVDYFSMEKEGFLKRILLRNLGFIGENTMIKQGFRFSRGYNIYLGKKVFINYNCGFQDSAEIIIDDFSLISPDVKIYTSYHDKITRRRYINQVYIGKRSWVGGGSIILPGIEVGENSIIGAGSLVNRDIEPDTIYVGNPIRKIGMVED